MATDVLQTKRGDCNEHTTLYTALSRAAGIPTRISVGLVYEKGFFYYHAWPEIFSGRWIAIDPTLGQFPADASHIRLLTGGIDKQSRILSVVGKIKVEGIVHW
jgi:transglutaminase-like putative cysteine protease